MFKRTKLSAGVVLAIGSGLLASVAPASAQDVQRVEVTGSAIKRIDSETSQPVQVIRREQIEQTGASSTVDLIQRLGVMQGATNEASSVGGSSYGFSGVSIHNVGETRTLVLLNGHRLSQFGGQTLTGFAAGFDLNAIPVAAIERIEVLTDGASALYGADAIAGVVNFITKRDGSDGDVSIGVSLPKDGAKEKRFSISKGFGSLNSDGFNLSLSFSHDERTKLNASDRDFASTGNLVFKKDGKTYRSQAYSASTIPANVLDDAGNLINPYLIANGSCPTNTFRVTDGADDFCGFDYVSTLEIYPERKRDAFMAGFTKTVGDHLVFADLLLSKTNQVSRIAPVPGGLTINAGSDLHNTYLLPLGIQETTTAFYRVYDLGLRTSDDTAKFMDLAVGSRGTLGAWDYEGTFSYSKSDVQGSISGYPGALALSALRKSGKLNPFVLPGQQSAEGVAALNAANYNGYWDGGVAELTRAALQGSVPLTKLGGGSLSLATGISAQKENFQSKPSLFAQGKLTNPVTGELCDENDPNKPCDQRFGDAAAAIAYKADRAAWGMFAEVLAPLDKTFELSGAVRFDHYSDFGSATTARGSFRWTPTKTMLVRGSVGTGFHAPSVPQVKASPQSYGVTNDPYDCTPELLAMAQSLGAECQPGVKQYDVLAGGNLLLKPEKSKQATFGIRLEPVSTLSMGVDWWWVGITDSFGQLDEADVFNNPQKYPGAWTTQKDIGTGTTYLAWNAGNLNLGNQFYSGLDFDVTSRIKMDLGTLTTQFTATRMLRTQLQDTTGAYSDPLGKYDQGGVTFPWQGRLSTTLASGSLSNTLALNYRSGYKDEANEVEVLDASGNVTGTEVVQLTIAPQITLDWQSKWTINKSFALTFGILNLFDKEPPFVLSTGGGQQVGYDDQYYDPRGRTLFATLSYKF